MGDSLDGSGEPSPESQNVSIVEFPTFANYLRKAVTVLLPDEDAVPPVFNLALEERYNQDCIRKFLGDSQVSSLYIQRSSTKGNLYVYSFFPSIALGDDVPPDPPLPLYMYTGVLTVHLTPSVRVRIFFIIYMNNLGT